jgi:hypothetical protein
MSVVASNLNTSEKQFYFKHIYNGMIFKDNKFFPMIEFKIVETDQDILNNILFCDTNFKCGWFIIEPSEYKLLGPINLNIEQIKTELKKRVIDDINYPDINGLEIEDISNDPEMLIPRDQLPDWMFYCLINKINIVNQTNNEIVDLSIDK